MDPDVLKKHNIKPVIHEIVRTDFIIPRICLLVEHVDVQDGARAKDGSPRQGYRLFLTDGQYRIQGLSQFAMCTE